MKVFALVQNGSDLIPDGGRSTGVVNIAGTPIATAEIDVPQIEFDARHPSHDQMVLLRVEALSCNYRDKTLLLSYAQRLMNDEKVPLSFIGSDFCARVIETGSRVTRWRAGDRVIPDAHYPDPPAPGVLPGVVTNHAGVGWLVVHESKLSRVPERMESAQAASFPLAAQTSMSMLRRAGVTEGDRVLVMSARSTTSQYLLAALELTGADIWATSTSIWGEEDRQRLHGAELLLAQRREPNLFNDEVAAKLLRNGGFTVVFDPFFDLHLERVIDLIGPGGRYVTCGLMEQHPQLVEARPSPNVVGWLSSLSHVLMKAVMGNISLIGNCIGESQDLERAIHLYDQGQLNVPLDSVYSSEQGADFLQRSFVDQDRTGKVVMSYS